MGHFMEEFVHLHFTGKTTSPWVIGRRTYSNYIFCQRFLWGRAVRGPVLGYMLKSYCPYLPSSTLPCEGCTQREDCPFYNLYGADNEGAFKDTPRLLITSLAFKTPRFPRMHLISRDAVTNGVALGPVTVEYIPPETCFEFEVIMTGEATGFVERLKEAVRATLTLTGWGARCSAGCGRGRIENVVNHGFDEWVSKYVERRVEELEGKRAFTLEIFPILMLEKEKNIYYTSVVEKGFRKKLANSMSERYWQFFKDSKYLRIEDVSGACVFTAVRAWSRKDNRQVNNFRGLAGELQLRLTSRLSKEDLRVVGVSWYGIGRFKNQGLGSLMLKSDSEEI